MNSLPIELPDIIIPDAPTEEELKAYMDLEISNKAFGKHVDIFRIDDAPPELHYEWHRPDNMTLQRLSLLGFVRNDALAARSKFLNDDKSEGNMIQDVACFTVRVEKKRALDGAFEIAKRMKLDPRTDYKQIAAQYLGKDYEQLQQKDINVNQREVLSGAEVQLAMTEDLLAAQQVNNRI